MIVVAILSCVGRKSMATMKAEVLPLAPAWAIPLSLPSTMTFPSEYTSAPGFTSVFWSSQSPPHEVYPSPSTSKPSSMTR